jgi:hypothetical protein
MLRSTSNHFPGMLPDIAGAARSVLVPSFARTPAPRPAPDLVADADTNVRRNPPVVIVSVGTAADMAGPSGTAVRRNPTRSSGASYAG